MRTLGAFGRRFSQGKFFTGFLVLVLFYGGATRLFAQSSQTPTSALGSMNSLERSDWPARAAVLGPAFTAVADDPSALFLNPAGLAYPSEGAIGLNSHLGWTGIFQETVLASIPLGAAGGLGLSGGYLGYGSFEGRDAAGSLTPSYSADLKNFDLGWGASFSPSFALGGAFHASEETLAGSGYFLWSPEVGLLWRPLAQISVGLDYTGAGGGTWVGSKVSTWKGALSWRFPLDSSVQVLTAFGVSNQSDSFDAIQAASEISFDQSFFIRAGYGTALQANGEGGFSGLSLGAGLALDNFQLDYAYLPGGELGTSHTFSLTYWARPPKAPVKNGYPPPTANQGVTTHTLALKFSIPSDFLSQAQTMEAQGQFPQAVTLYQEALGEDPQNAQGWEALGQINLRLKRKEEAEACFQKVLQLNPGNAQAQQGLLDCKSVAP
jgi:hypothetical protein